MKNLMILVLMLNLASCGLNARLEGMELSGISGVAKSDATKGSEVGSATMSGSECTTTGYSLEDDKSGLFEIDSEGKILLASDNPPAGTYNLVVIGTCDDQESRINVQVVITAPVVVDQIIPDGYIKIPVNPNYPTVEEFYVSKWEMRNDGNNLPKATGVGLPWNNTSTDIAVERCSALGEGYKLISNMQWQVIARNITEQDENWSQGQIGQGCLFTGVSWSGAPSHPSSVDCSVLVAYNFGALDSVNPSPKRVHRLSTNEEIIDFSGNLSEWTLNSIAVLGNTGVGNATTTNLWSGAQLTTNVNIDGVNSNLAYHLGAKQSYTSADATSNGDVNQGFGFGYNWIFNFSGAILRGSSYTDSYDSAGIYRTTSTFSSSSVLGKAGFRCVYSK